MKKIAMSLLCLCSFLLGSNHDPLQGKMLALSCASCHGTDGKSTTVMPHIAGMDKQTLYKVLLEYKQGKREGTMMEKHTKGFTDEELEKVADYFSKIEE